MEPVTLFSWGFWGWGTSTPQLLQAVDAVERGRGFEPPLFVDIRFQRSGRAPGFVGGAFKDLVGSERYCWMKSLGNRRIGSHSGPRIQINDPAAAEKLLDLALESARQNRRLLFYCACMFPRWEGKTKCHRDEVGDLVLQAAGRRALPVEIVEWPGGEPATAVFEVKPAVLQAVRQGRKTVPLGKELPQKFAGLAWGSIVTLRAGRDSMPVISGPAKFKGQWVLPVLMCREPGREVSALKKDAQEVRQFLGFESRTA